MPMFLAVEVTRFSPVLRTLLEAGDAVREVARGDTLTGLIGALESAYEDRVIEEVRAKHAAAVALHGPDVALAKPGTWCPETYPIPLEVAPHAGPVVVTDDDSDADEDLEATALEEVVPLHRHADDGGK